jgi:hypothetical protein
MNELSQLISASPQAALVGATVYVILTQRRIESRIEAIAIQVGAPPRQKRNGRWLGILLAVFLVTLFAGCKSPIGFSALWKKTPKTEQIGIVITPGQVSPGITNVQSP